MLIEVKEVEYVIDFPVGQLNNSANEPHLEAQIWILCAKQEKS